jgi:hypothetical protein
MIFRKMLKPEEHEFDLGNLRRNLEDNFFGYIELVKMYLRVDGVPRFNLLSGIFHVRYFVPTVKKCSSFKIDPHKTPFKCLEQKFGRKLTIYS